MKRFQNYSVTSPWQFNGVKNFSYFCHVLIALCCLSSFFFLLFFCMLLILFCMQMSWKLRNIFSIFSSHLLKMKFMFCSLFNYSNRKKHFSVQLNIEIPRSIIADQLWTLPSCVILFLFFLWLNFILIFQFSFSLLTFYGFYVRYFE